jgi:hypothetical protein
MSIIHERSCLKTMCRIRLQNQIQISITNESYNK